MSDHSTTEITPSSVSPETGSDVVALLVHGVGPFDKEATGGAVFRLLKQRFPELLVSVRSFAWRDLVKEVRKGAELDLGEISALSKAALRSSFRIGDRGNSRLSRLEGIYRCSLVLWVAICLVMPALVLAHTLGWISKLPSLWLFGVFVFCIGLPFHVESRVLPSLRATILPFLWPWLHLIMVLPYIASRFVAKSSSFLVPALLYLGGPLWYMFVAEFVGKVFGVESGLWQLILGFVLGVVPGMVLFFVLAGLFYLVWKTYLRLVESPLGIGAMVLADILRYLGIPEYRKNLLCWLRDEIDRAAESGCRAIFIAGHSLGSVVALDALDGWKPSRRGLEIRLVTMGSPLRRLFHRFFPGSYDSPDDFAVRLERSLEGLRWVNVYRPKDYIGTRLFLRQRWRDAPSQSVGLLGSHTGYWNDEAVLETAVERLSHEPRAALSTEPRPRPSAPDDVWPLDKPAFRRPMVFLASYAPFGLALYSWWWFWSSLVENSAPILLRWPALAAWAVLTIVLAKRVGVPYGLSLVGGPKAAEDVPTLETAMKEFDDAIKGMGKVATRHFIR